jgi:hypothetical protein
MRTAPAAALILPSVLAVTLSASAQTIDTVGTRARGMGGAFVGVADDASAVYWNPGGLARGAYFSLLLDGSTAEAVPDGELSAGRRSGWLLALSTPAVGLSYYRLQTTTVSRPPTVSRSAFQLDSLTTHHLGATLLQSLTDGVAVGTTLKLIRGVAGSELVAMGDLEEILDHAELIGRSESQVDLDVGVMATGRIGKAGIVVRNLREPGFETADGTELNLERQIRGGASVLLLQTWKLAADVDFTRQTGAFGDVREVAVGSEGQVTRRLAARAGLRINTAGDHGRTPAFSIGASFAPLGSVLIDAQLTAGSDKAFSGWGIAGRMVF